MDAEYRREWIDDFVTAWLGLTKDLDAEYARKVAETHCEKAEAAGYAGDEAADELYSNETPGWE